MERIRPHVKVGSSHDAAVAALVSRAQRSTSPKRVNALMTSLTLALHRVRDT
jgi:hypothetical protein